MRLDRPQAKFCLKSDSNRLFIDFFNLISAVRFYRPDNSIQIQTINRSQNLIYIEKELK